MLISSSLFIDTARCSFIPGIPTLKSLSYWPVSLSIIDYHQIASKNQSRQSDGCCCDFPGEPSACVLRTRASGAAPDNNRRSAFVSNSTFVEGPRQTFPLIKPVPASILAGKSIMFQASRTLPAENASTAYSAHPRRRQKQMKIVSKQVIMCAAQ